MNTYHFDIHKKDTIIALSTPEGIGAIAVIRLSGENAFTIIQEIFPTKKIAEQKGNTIHFGRIIYNNETIDEVMISIFKAPFSYTGENSIEISCHGSPYIIQQIIKICIATGARLAKAGEFTQRAFFNGKLDLTQAEAVADLIHSENAAMHKSSLQNMRGGFSKKLKALKEKLIEFSALIELELDFAEEDVAFADRTKFLTIIQTIQQELNFLENSFEWGNVIKNGINIAIIGKPNAGKSTLLNALLQEERAIVSPIAGTTRDSIEETIQYKGITFRFIDTAGIRKSNDEIELIGIEKAYKKMEQADMILYLFDAKEISLCELIEQEDYFKNKNYNYLLIANKIDTLENILLEVKLNAIKNYFPIIAKEHSGIDKILEHIYSHFTAQKQQQKENITITNNRHLAAIKKIQENLTLIEKGLKNNLSGDLLSVEIKHCLYHIGELTGEVTNENILDYIFSKFCIGK